MSLQVWCRIRATGSAYEAPSIHNDSDPYFVGIRVMQIISEY